MLQLIRTTLLVLLLAGLPVGVSMAQTPATAGKDSLTEAAIAAGHRVMEEFMTAFNARDVEAWSQTLLFPHVRVASGDVTVSADRDALSLGPPESPLYGPSCYGSSQIVPQTW